MKRLILCAVLLITFSKFLHAQDVSSLEWGRPITFVDFEAPPNQKDTAAASISVTILLGYTNNRNNTLKFKVVAVMDKDESWIKEEFKTHEILKHEQGHFDIAHIYAKRLEASLGGHRYTTKDVKKLHEIYDIFLARMHELQTRYDQETRGGLKSGKQVMWERFIGQELAGVNE